MSVTGPHLRISGINPLGQSFSVVVVPNDPHDFAKLQTVLAGFGFLVSKADLQALPVRPPSGGKVKVDDRTMRQVVRYLQMEDSSVKPEVSLAKNPVLVALIEKIARETNLGVFERKNVGKEFGRRLREMFTGCQSTNDVVPRIKLYLGESMFPFEKAQAAVEALLRMAEQNRQFCSRHERTERPGLWEDHHQGPDVISI